MLHRTGHHRPHDGTYTMMKLARLLVAATVLAACGSPPVQPPTVDTPPAQPVNDAIETPNAAADTSPPTPPSGWWDEAVFYAVDVRGFYDSDGDGIGDLRGLTDKLDVLTDGANSGDDLGVTGLLLAPPPAPAGTKGDFEVLMTAAHTRGAKVVVALPAASSAGQTEDAVRAWLAKGVDGVRVSAARTVFRANDGRVVDTVPEAIFDPEVGQAIKDGMTTDSTTLLTGGATMRLAAALRFASPPTPSIQFGEEIGMLRGGRGEDLPPHTPMRWDCGETVGFTTGAPWQAIPTALPGTDVAAQRARRGTLWTLYQSLIDLRRTHTALWRGTLTPLVVQGGGTHVAAFVREDALSSERILIIANLGDTALDSFSVDLLGVPSVLLTEGLQAPVRTAAGLAFDGASPRAFGFVALSPD
ncbi:MAG: glycosidase [Myxococcota bacterium]|jgi:glycosidase